MAPTTPEHWPDFDSLPLDPSGPPGNAWGLFGAQDELGMLNLLTPQVIAAAAKEIQHGVRVSLDWPLDKPSYPTFTRKRFEHQLIHDPTVPMNDDVIHINTQSSTQWDGFRHFCMINLLFFMLLFRLTFGYHFDQHNNSSTATHKAILNLRTQSSG